MTYLAVFCHLHLSRYSKICPAISCLLDYPCLLYSNLQWKNNALYRSLLCCFCIYNGKLLIANAYLCTFLFIWNDLFDFACVHIQFCKLCDEDCPCERSKSKPNCHMCKVSSLCLRLLLSARLLDDIWLSLAARETLNWWRQFCAIDPYP